VAVCEPFGTLNVHVAVGTGSVSTGSMKSSLLVLTVKLSWGVLPIGCDAGETLAVVPLGGEFDHEQLVFTTTP